MTVTIRTGIAQSVVGVALALGLMLPAAAQKFEIKPVAEKKVKQLPSGTLYWRLENFPTLAQAEAAAGATSLAAEVAGKVWLFTLGEKGGATRGGSKVVEIGPVPPINASEYLLRIMQSGSSRARVLKLADRISNLTALGFVHDGAFVQKYLEETRACILPHARDVNPDMFRELTDLVESRAQFQRR